MKGFETLCDLASLELGGAVLSASDEQLGSKARLLAPEPPRSPARHCGEAGRDVDAWLTRRRRDPGYDHVVIRLGAPGLVHRVTLDTRGVGSSRPDAVSIEGCCHDAFHPIEGAAGPETIWTELLHKTSLAEEASQDFELRSGLRFTHVRVRIYPDGGLARVRVWGRPLARWRPSASGGRTMQLADARLGAEAERASDESHAPASSLLLPGASRHPGDGWETRRRRGPGHEWVVVRLAAVGLPHQIEIDTTGFAGSTPELISVEHALLEPGQPETWKPLVARTPVLADMAHAWSEDLVDPAPASHVRLRIYPDGGLARFRVLGTPTPTAERELFVRWLDALLPDEARRVLYGLTCSGRWLDRMVGGRPHRTFAAFGAAAGATWAALDSKGWVDAICALAEQRRAAPALELLGDGEPGLDADVGEPSREDAPDALYEARFGFPPLLDAQFPTAEARDAHVHELSGRSPELELKRAAQIVRSEYEETVRAWFGAPLTE
jgi:allantoicase